jgi:hypothetical protein
MPTNPQPRRDEHGIPWCDEHDCPKRLMCDTMKGAGRVCVPALLADYAAHAALRAAAESVVALGCPSPGCEDGLCDSGGVEPWGAPISIPCPWEGHALEAALKGG